jgi:serine/threonine protein kinase
MNKSVIKPGTKVGRFEIEKKLGEGGMASVYLAKDLRLFRKAALKVLEQNKVLQALTLDQRKNLKNRFVREAQTAALINHPNITQIYDANFDSDGWYIACTFYK